MPPNVISVASVFAAAAAAAALLLLPATEEGGQVVLLVVAGVFIQLRLLANMLDGLVAIEGGLRSSSGDLFNEVPDRVDDVVILAAAGYAIPALIWAPVLGWTAAVLALLTAYIRVLGGTLGAPQTFAGPMAKPHRMFILTIACAGSIAEVAVRGYHGYVLAAGLGVIVFGAGVTCVRRLLFIQGHLASR